MYELSVHDYDLINWIMDAVPETVEADLRYSDTWVKEDKAFLNVEYSNGVKGQLMTSYSKGSKYAPYDFTMIFVGENGYMRVERPNRIVLVTDDVKVIDIEPIGVYDIFELQIQKFIDKLNAGEEYIPNIKDGALPTFLVEAANKAYKEGKKVAF